MAKTAAKPAKSSAVAQKPSKPTVKTDKVPSDLENLLVDSIKDLYWAENHLVKTLPKIREAAGDAALRKAVADHLKVTKGHVARLEKIFELLGKPPQAKKCDAMEGLAMEGESIINATIAGTPARDRGLIMACQKVEHYEIASYRGLVLLASQLGKLDVGELLKNILGEEEEADSTLATLAEKNR